MHRNSNMINAGVPVALVRTTKPVCTVSILKPGIRHTGARRKCPHSRYYAAPPGSSPCAGLLSLALPLCGSPLSASITCAGSSTTSIPATRIDAVTISEKKACYHHVIILTRCQHNGQKPEALHHLAEQARRIHTPETENVTLEAEKIAHEQRIRKLEEALLPARNWRSGRKSERLPASHKAQADEDAIAMRPADQMPFPCIYRKRSARFRPDTGHHSQMRR